MRKTLFSLGLFGFCIFANAQVGIGTSAPNASLDVVKTTTNPTTAKDGIIPPNVSKLELASKVANTYGTTQTGAIVYVATINGVITGPSVAQVANITTVGYYYFDGTVWQKMTPSITGFDATNDAWVNNPASTRVELGTSSDGITVRTASNAFVATDAGRVGIGTVDPNASLEVVKSTLNPTTAKDGIIPPNVTKAELANKAALTYGTAQRGAITYVTDVTAATGTPVSAAQVVNINTVGLYQFDGAVWFPVGGAVKKIVGVLVAPTAAAIPNNSGTSVNLGSNITLPSGRWEVEVYMLLNVGSSLSDTYTWAKLSFSNSPSSTIISTDIKSTSTLISGGVTTSVATGGDTNPFFGVISGKVIIENLTNAPKTYYLIFAGSNNKGPVRNINNLGSNNFSENFIAAMRIE